MGTPPAGVDVLHQCWLRITQSVDTDTAAAAAPAAVGQRRLTTKIWPTFSLSDTHAGPNVRYEGRLGGE